MSTTCKLTDIISGAFSDPHRALKTGIVNQLVLKGGRGSAKSSYASVEGILKILQNPEIHGVVMRKVSNTLRTSVYAQYVWAISALGLHQNFKATVSPMELTYRPTGQKIMFFGADDPGKLKSIKVPFGYIGFLHFEELDQFSGEEEIRNIEQSVLRGGPVAIEIKTFNPPRTRDNWANLYVLTPKAGQLIHHSTYETTPREWLGERFLHDAEHLRETNPAAYEHEYHGVANGTGGSVFENIKTRDISDDEIASFERVYHGVDFGWYPDPWAYVQCAYNPAKRVLYIFKEARAEKTNNRDTADALFEAGAPKSSEFGSEPVVCDSAEPKSIADYASYGLLVRGAEKGPDSVKYSIKWLQGLSEIVIDSARCPHSLKEFNGYEYERARDGSIISGYPDKNNHHIDAVRYATNLLWRQGGK